MVPFLTPSILTNILQHYQQTGDRWFAVIYAHSHSLFFALAILDTIWFGVLLAINRQRFDNVLMRIVMHVVGLGFFLTMLEKGREWVTAIINSFIQIGQEASGVQSLDPSSIVDQAIGVAGSMLASIGVLGLMTHPITATTTAITALIAFLCMAVVAGHVLFILIEMQLVIGLSPLLFAFGGCRWTRPVAGKYLSFVLSTGMSLLALYCMIGVAESLTGNWKTRLEESAELNLMVYFEVILSAIMYFFLVWRTPHRVADMFAGAVSLTMTELERTGEMLTSSFSSLRGWGGNLNWNMGGGPTPVSPLTPSGGGGASSTTLTAAWQSATNAAATAAAPATGGVSTAVAGSAAVLQQFRNASQQSQTGQPTPQAPPQVSNPALQGVLNKWSDRGKS